MASLTFRRRGFIDLYPLYYNVVGANGEVTSRSQMYPAPAHAAAAARELAKQDNRRLRDRRPLPGKP